MTSTLPAPVLDGPDFTRPDVQAHYIDQAANHIERFGKHEGDYWPITRDDQGIWFTDQYAPGMPCCTVGALAVSLGLEDPNEVEHQLAAMDGPVHPVLAALVRELGGAYPKDVFDWSDRAREDQVVARLREIAAQLRAQVEIPTAVA